jgi:hypothetical protein
MSFERTSYGRRPEEKAASEPHPDANRNLAYCQDLLKKIEILEPTLYWEFYDTKTEGYDPEGNPLKIISEPKFIFFQWKEGNQDWTGSRSFHMNHDEFRKDFVDAINFLLQKRFVKRFGVAIGTKKKKPKDLHIFILVCRF